MNVNVLIKIVLSLLFVLCLLDMPYGYFQFVRLVGFVGFLILAYQSTQVKESVLVIVYVLLALLFQPFVKVSLGRELWNIVDVVASIFLIGTLFLPVEKKND